MFGNLSALFAPHCLLLPRQEGEASEAVAAMEAGVQDGGEGALANDDLACRKK